LGHEMERRPEKKRKECRSGGDKEKKLCRSASAVIVITVPTSLKFGFKKSRKRKTTDIPNWAGQDCQEEMGC